MNEYKVKIETTIEADSLDEAQDKANDINLYYSLRRGGDELDNSVEAVEPVVAELNDMATDEVLDHYIKEFKTASDYLGNAFDQAEVTKDQEQRIKAILWFWSAKLSNAKPVLE